MVGLIGGRKIVNGHSKAQVTILLKIDVRPDLPQVWGWPDLGEELSPVANF